MYSRVTQLEIDTMRVDVDAAVELFRDDVVPSLREQEGFEGAVVLATPDGKGLIVTMWEDEEAATAAAGLAADAIAGHITLFKSPPGREVYEVVFADVPAVAIG
jgi:heme-degrading monooxygenase HmoA